ncbi:crotonase/enoyl-CoA hydratase family protein [Rhodococcus sp. CSLK01-03]|uniref:Crotonase/enoyl-CoA hydratase family protein n=1 Tax=Rhodococcus indonesiensis TaxID=3055869 RepID=A0ABT7RTC7_9NOCA|nr:crotonase/enoyl-CoA hydratase family protein [Rhodococcus indonesiensis]MDM7490896.1 crotonase/enoyl-CoA hydratase family protein [Rhodococcus indonesiensis]
MTFRGSTVRYAVRDHRAYVTLNRPDRLNAITAEMATEIASAVAEANSDDAVRVIVVQGAGRAFCAGYDLKMYAEGGVDVQPDVWDPIKDFRAMKANTDHFFSLWRSAKPTVAKVHGYAVAGGSDIALSCDLVVMADDARIGYMPSRVWGCPTTAMWVYRLGAEKAKRMLLTGDTITGTQAQEWGLVAEAVPGTELDDAVERLADRVCGVPINQLVMQKLMINQALDNMGLQSTQNMAILFDGITRHSPEGRWFVNFAQTHGFDAAVQWRDSGRFIPDGGGPVPDEDEIAEMARELAQHTGGTGGRP